MPHVRAHRIAIPIAHGVVLADVTGPSEMFQRAASAAGAPCYRVRLCGATQRVRTRDCVVHAPFGLDELRRADTVLVPGFDDPALPPDPRIVDAVRLAAQRGARIASVCTGAFVLASAGLLDGRTATTHWAAAALLQQRFPGVRVDPNVLYVDEGQVITSAGATAALDMCLHMIGSDVGASVAMRTAKLAVVPLLRRGGQAQFIDAGVRTASARSPLEPLMQWIEANLRQDLSIGVLARRANVSARTLHRRFLQETGRPPAGWVLDARVRRARALLESSACSIESVAEQCGFGGTTTLRERFAEQTHTTPSAYRLQFGTRIGGRVDTRPAASASARTPASRREPPPHAVLESTRRRR